MNKPLKACLALCVAFAGCGERSTQTLRLPDFSPGDAAKQLLADYDVNKDGQLDGKELEKCPALKGALEAIDTGGDGRLSSEEIATRLATYKTGGVAMMGITCTVSLDESPLPGAEVTFEPERCMGSNFQSASGVSDADGTVVIRLPGSDVPGLNCGLYRVRVTSAAQGKAAIPAKFNTQTTLGYEIAPSMRDGHIHLRLTRR